ncbi:hypothetical protein ACQP2K_13125 [Microbispora siamensis]
MTGPLVVTVVTGLASPAPAMAVVGAAAACAAVLVALLPHRRVAGRGAAARSGPTPGRA